MVQGRYVLCLLLEYAAPLGLFDVAYRAPERARDDFGLLWGSGEVAALSRYDGLHAFRITGLGADCLGGTATHTRPDSAFPPGRAGPHRRPPNSARP